MSGYRLMIEEITDVKYKEPRRFEGAGGSFLRPGPLSQMILISLHQKSENHDSSSELEQEIPCQIQNDRVGFHQF